MIHAHIHTIMPIRLCQNNSPLNLFSELAIQFCFRNAVAIYDDIIQYISVDNTEYLVHESWSTHQTTAPAVS